MNYCTYAYLREDGTPYYIGKGKKHRPYSKNRLFKPPSKDRILILKSNLTEEEAIRHEIYMIAIFGRKDLGTGILRNLTNGGEGISGYVHREESKQKIGEVNSTKRRSKEVRDQISNSVKGYSWYNNGSVNIQSRRHPGEGWTKGRLLSWHSPRSLGLKWYHRNGVRKMFAEDPGEGWILGRPRPKGKRYYNNGTDHVLAFECPGEGWVPGRLSRK